MEDNSPAYWSEESLSSLVLTLQNPLDREWFFDIGVILSAMLSRSQSYGMCLCKRLAVEIAARGVKQMGPRKIHDLVRIAKEFNRTELQALPSCSISNVREVLRIPHHPERLRLLNEHKKHRALKSAVETSLKKGVNN